MATRYLPRAMAAGSAASAGTRGASIVSAATAASMVDFTMSLPNWRRTIERHTRLLLGWIMTDLVIRVATADARDQRAGAAHGAVSNSRDYPPQAVEMIVANFAP